MKTLMTLALAALLAAPAIAGHHRAARTQRHANRVERRANRDGVVTKGEARRTARSQGRADRAQERTPAAQH